MLRVHEQSQLILDNIHDYAVFMMDPTGNIVSWNAGAEHITGYHADEVVGRHFSIFYPAEDVPDPEEDLRSAAEYGGIEDEGWRVRKDTSRFWANVVITPLVVDGDLRGFVNITRDLTIRKHNEDAIKAHAEELEEKNRVLLQANESLDAFSYVVGHDLKEPVRAVENRLTVLERDHSGELSEEARFHIAKAREANRRLSVLVTDLLAISRASRRDLTDVRPIEIADALYADECTLRFSESVVERNALLELPDRGFCVRANLPALCQIFGNLIHNALRHNPADQPVVRVNAQRTPDGKMVEVVVEDNGPGFPPDVSNGFTRATGTRRGFGLAIAKRTVALLGGQMWLGTSREGGGAVHFTLPAAPMEEGLAPVQKGSSPQSQDHGVCVYDTLVDLAAPLDRFLRDGLSRRELAVFIHSFSDDEDAWRFLASVRPNVRDLAKRQFVLVQSYRSAFQGRSPTIDYGHVKQSLDELLESARAQGHNGVRLFVDASRAYFDADRRGEWFEFESWVGQNLQLGVALVCAYRRSDLAKGSTLSDLLRTHAYRIDAPDTRAHRIEASGDTNE